MSKEKLKNNKWLISAYEAVMSPIHRLSYIVKKKIMCFIASIKKSEILSYGEKNPDKTFVILSPFSMCGIYSSILLNLPYIERIKRSGYYPIMDFQNYYNPMMQDEEKKGIENAWTYYYKQIGDYKLEDVYQSKNVILEWNRLKRIKIPEWNKMLPMNKKELVRWNKVVRENICLTDQLSEQIIKIKETLFMNRRVLGVGIRAEYRALMIRKQPLIEGHPKVPDCEEMIRIVEKKMKDWGYDYIFLSCDDREYLEKFVEYLGESCLYLERPLLHFFSNDKPNDDKKVIYQEQKNISIRQQQDEYIEEVYLLAQCDSLYCCIGGGYQFAYIVNGGKYQHFEAYNEGLVHL